MLDITIILLCGGTGERLWPLSRKSNPKQFIKIEKNKSLLDLTIQRSKILSKNNPIIISSFDYYNHIEQSCVKNGIYNLSIFEEIGRNTTASIYFGVKMALEMNENKPILIMPCDHKINNIENFANSIILAYNNYEKYNWLTFGIKPDFPSTDYGYIKTSSKQKLRNVLSFIEKPDIEEATKIYTNENFFWNSGVFFGSAKKILASIKCFNENNLLNLEKAWNNKEKIKKSFIIQKKNLIKIKTSSIDYDVLEKEKSIGLITTEWGWSDVGTWDRFFKNYKDIGKKIFKYKAKNSSVYSPEELTVILNVPNIFVANIDGVTFIADKKKHYSLKSLLNILRHKKIAEVENFNFSIEKWGRKKQFIQSKNDNLSILEINKNSELFLNLKINLSYRFILVSGRLEILFNNKKFYISKGDTFSVEYAEKIKFTNLNKSISKVMQFSF